MPNLKNAIILHCVRMFGIRWLFNIYFSTWCNHSQNNQQQNICFIVRFGRTVYCFLFGHVLTYLQAGQEMNKLITVIRLPYNFILFIQKFNDLIGWHRNMFQLNFNYENLIFFLFFFLSLACSLSLSLVCFVFFDISFFLSFFFILLRSHSFSLHLLCFVETTI